ncbi:hypothetical protein [Marinitoga sp. 1155]|uniref:hypothetical protein n=1 Tax=Marinitoga sp. 1155 TaxID=1428448 RepID=UPI0006410AD1|nr:hypothetical protein [Marinitoga sp. 1155]KLO21886.1 hypothetical protein X274_09435 [Marinitoga sp. 1155]
MKKNVYLAVLILVLSLLLTSCITESKNKIQNTQQIFNNNYILQKVENNISLFSLKNDLYALEITFKGKIDKDKFTFNDVPFKIIDYVNGNTVVSISFGKLQKKDWNFLKVSGDHPILRVEGVKSLDNMAIKNTSEATPMLLGDFNHDSYVDLFDFAYFKEHYRTTASHPNYDELYDIYPSSKGTDIFANIYSLKNSDGVINLYDFAIFAVNYRKAANRPPKIKIVSPLENSKVHGGIYKIKIKNMDPDLNNIIYDIYLNDEKFFKNVTTLEKDIMLDYPLDYTMTIIATDIVNSNSKSLSTTTNVKFKTINTPPDIIFENLKDVMPYNFKLKVYANDYEEGIINNIDIILNDKKIEKDSDNNFIIKNLDRNIEYTITAIATDSKNMTSTKVATFTTVDLPYIYLEYNKDENMLYIKGRDLNKIKVMTITLLQNDDIKFYNAVGENGFTIAYSEYNNNNEFEFDVANLNSSDDGTIAKINVIELRNNTSVFIKRVKALNNNMEVMAIDYSSWVDIIDDVIENPIEYYDMWLHANSHIDLNSNLYYYFGVSVGIKENYNVLSINIIKDGNILFSLDKKENNKFEAFYSLPVENINDFLHKDYIIEINLENGKTYRRTKHIDSYPPPLHIITDIDNQVVPENENIILEFEPTDPDYIYNNTHFEIFDENRNNLILSSHFDVKDGYLSIPYENFEYGKKYLCEIWLMTKNNEAYRVFFTFYYGKKPIIKNTWGEINTEEFPERSIINIFGGIEVSDYSNIEKIVLSNDSIENIGEFIQNTDNLFKFEFEYDITNKDLSLYENQNYYVTAYLTDGSSETVNGYIGYIYKLSDLDKINITSPQKNYTISDGSDIIVSWNTGNLDYSKVDIHLWDSTNNDYRWISSFHIDNNSIKNYTIPSSYFENGHKYDVILLFWSNQDSPVRITKRTSFYYGFGPVINSLNFSSNTELLDSENSTKLSIEINGRLEINDNINIKKIVVSNDFIGDIGEFLNDYNNVYNFYLNLLNKDLSKYEDQNYYIKVYDSNNQIIEIKEIYIGHIYTSKDIENMVSYSVDGNIIPENTDLTINFTFNENKEWFYVDLYNNNNNNIKSGNNNPFIISHSDLIPGNQYLLHIDITSSDNNYLNIKKTYYYISNTYLKDGFDKNSILTFETYNEIEQALWTEKSLYKLNLRIPFNEKIINVDDISQIILSKNGIDLPLILEKDATENTYYGYIKFENFPQDYVDSQYNLKIFTKKSTIEESFYIGNIYDESNLNNIEFTSPKSHDIISNNNPINVSWVTSNISYDKVILILSSIDAPNIKKIYYPKTDQFTIPASDITPNHEYFITLILENENSHTSISKNIVIHYGSYSLYSITWVKNVSNVFFPNITISDYTFSFRPKTITKFFGNLKYLFFQSKIMINPQYFIFDTSYDYILINDSSDSNEIAYKTEHKIPYEIINY